MFVISEAWRAAYPGAAVGILAMRGVANPPHHEALDQRKAALEQELRARFAGYDRASLRTLPVLEAYHAYYKRFKKTYHVQLQLESVTLKGKSIPGGAALVEAMFMAELKHLLLTAGHDMAVVEAPVAVKVADGTEQYLRLNRQEQTLKAGDMYIADAQGVLSSILYGPDYRTRITPETRQVLFTTYAPSGIGAGDVHRHLETLHTYVQLISPGAEVATLEVFEAAPGRA
jgi:DNA/RNA-binding domain of Phe-tRNA-synthetase-like protein